MVREDPRIPPSRCRVRYTGASEVILNEVSHTYDGVSNRLTRTDNMSYGMEPAGTDTLSYGTANELLTLKTTTYGYDAKGNRTSKTEASGSTTYSYDDENRLVRVEIPGSPALVITYTYDPFGRRIEKNVNGTITRYLYDQEDILLEYNGAGSIAARYLHGPGIDEPLAMEKDGQMYYYQADGLGSVIALADSTGGIAQTYRYDAFGSLVSDAPAIVQPYTYTARELDPETGLYYYRARHYDPKAGRFLQRDPIGFAGGDANLYAYVGNNPITGVDPSGLFNILLGFGVSVAAPTGADVSVGIVVNPGLFGQKADAGLFGSAGGTVGVNVSGDVFIGFVQGDIENVGGVTANFNLTIGPLSLTFFVDPKTGGIMGGTVGIGPAATPVGASGSLTYTGALTVRDVFSSKAAQAGICGK